MSHRVWNPKRGKYVPAKKKGTAGTKQVWLDKEVGSEFRTEMNQTAQPDPHQEQQSGSSMHRMTNSPNGTGSTQAPRTRKTKLLWNNNPIKEIDGDISVNDAIEIMSAHFREVTRENVTVEYDADTKNIKATMGSGSKH